MLKSENIYKYLDKIMVETYNEEKEMYPTDGKIRKLIINIMGK